jgi:hypothetical protein
MIRRLGSFTGERFDMERNISGLTIVRLCLSGAVAGAALISVAGGFFGYGDTVLRDALGATVGAVGVLTIKAMHVI